MLDESLKLQFIETYGNNLNPFIEQLDGIETKINKSIYNCTADEIKDNIKDIQNKQEFLHRLEEYINMAINEYYTSNPVNPIMFIFQDNEY